MCCVFVSTFRLMLHVMRASLDLGLKESVYCRNLKLVIVDTTAAPVLYIVGQ